MIEKKFKIKAREEIVTPVISVEATQVEERSPVQDVIDATQVLMAYIPEDIRRDITEASESMQIPLWQMLLGYAVRCWDGKLTYAPFILSSWESGTKASSNHRCESCGRMFHSRFPDARFCCNDCHFGKIEERGHSPECLVEKD